MWVYVTSDHHETICCGCLCIEDDDDVVDDDDNNNNQLYDIVELTSINKWLKKILSDGEWIIQHTHADTFFTN